MPEQPRSEPRSFTGDPELERKKQDIADRSYRLSMISTVISIVTAVAGVALLLLLPGIGGMIAGAVVGLGGPLLTTMFVQKEQEKLRLDREFLESEFQGGNWGRGNWRGYRQEVAEHGYAGPQAPGAFSGPPPHQTAQRNPGNRGGGSQVS